jgi:3'-5' exoribonuclease
MAQPILSELPIGTRVQDPFIVLDVEARGGDTPHTILTFGNAHGRLQSAPFWPSDSPKITGVSRGCVVQVIGTVGAYRDRRQLTVDSLRVLPREQVDWHALMPSVGDVSRYWKAIDRWRGEVRGPRLARVLSLFYDDPAFRERYEQCPASTSGHHAALGGLLKHTCEVVHIGHAICRLYASADPDLVAAGVLLHDIGKLDSYRWDGVFEVTVPGSVIGHVVLGALMLDRRVRAETPMPCTEDELLLLQHLVLSHHGKLEFGAPVAPMTLEAEIIHYADNASAKTASMDEALRDSENFVGDSEVSARPVWQIDRRRAWRASSDWGRPAIDP